MSIIRLRSEELTQSEIAYYFAALTLGLLGGLDQSASWVDLALMAAVVLAIAVGDSPRLVRRPEVGQFLLDHAYTDRALLVGHLEGLLDGTILSAKVLRVDIVNDTTHVDVRYFPDRVGTAVADRMAVA